MEIKDKSVLRNKDFSKSQGPAWLELASIISRIDNSDVIELSVEEYSKRYERTKKGWRTALRMCIKSTGKRHGKKLNVVFEKGTDICYFWLTEV